MSKSPSEITAAAFDKTAARYARLMGDPTADPEVAFYEQLGPADFKNIQTKYGLSGLVDYVKHIEFKRLLGRK
jgi:hypothetical protein